MTPELIATICRLRKQNGYSVQLIAQRLKISRTQVWEALRADLTPLNIRTTKKWEACKARGGCVAGPSFTAHGYFLTPCKRCGVPMKPRGWGWADNTTMFPERYERGRVA